MFDIGIPDKLVGKISMICREHNAQVPLYIWRRNAIASVDYKNYFELTRISRVYRAQQ